MSKCAQADISQQSTSGETRADDSTLTAFDTYKRMIKQFTTKDDSPKEIKETPVVV